MSEPCTEVIYEACNLCEQPVKVTERNRCPRTDKMLHPIYCTPPCIAPNAVATAISRWADQFGTHARAKTALSTIGPAKNSPAHNF